MNNLLYELTEAGRKRVSDSSVLQLFESKPQRIAQVHSLFDQEKSDWNEFVHLLGLFEEVGYLRDVSPEHSMIGGEEDLTYEITDKGKKETDSLTLQLLAKGPMTVGQLLAFEKEWELGRDGHFSSYHFLDQADLMKGGFADKGLVREE